MKKLGWVTVLALVVIACGTGADMMGEILDSGVPDAGAESPGDGSGMQYVGNSDQTFRGDNTYHEDDGDGGYAAVDPIGIFVYYAACQETFGAGHRTCTREEIVFTTEIPNVEGFAWYGIESDCPNGTRPAVNATGVFSEQRCTGYPIGSVYAPDAVELPIACCGPK